MSETICNLHFSVFNFQCSFFGLAVLLRGPHAKEAIPTINRPPLGRSERHCGFNSTQGAFDGDFDSPTREGLAVSLRIGRDLLVLFQLTRLAPLGGIS